MEYENSTVFKTVISFQKLRKQLTKRKKSESKFLRISNQNLKSVLKIDF